MRTLGKLTLLALAIAIKLPAAHAVGSLVDLSVFDRNTGRSVTVYHHRGEYWIAGTPGHRYGVTLVSRRQERTLTVVSVDGINVISGETAAWDQTGYVLEGLQSTRIDGWRKSQTQIASFVFTALPDSYASRTGRPQNAGTIGIATFHERRPPVPQPALVPNHYDQSLGAQSGDMESAAPSARALPDKSRRSGQLGTGHGQREYSEISYTGFERASPGPDEIVAIRYASRDRLIAMGIIPAPPRPHSRPQPFPGSLGFVPDPPR